MKRPIDVILIGAGNRGKNVYGRYISKHPNQFRLAAAADPIAARRKMIAKKHQLPEDKLFESWEDLLAEPQLGQAAIIATQDQQHTAPTLAALKAGYDVLLEKPMANHQEECVALVQAAQQSGRLLQICHVLRYTPVMQKVKQLLDSGVLGDVMTVSHRENVSFWHMAHSYVRGNWRNTDVASPMILAKSCHDLDLLYWLLERKVERLSSVGSLKHFRPDQAPPGAPERCTDGCPVADSCPFEATQIYLHLEPFFKELNDANQPLYRAAGKVIGSPIGFTALKALSKVAPPFRKLRNYHGWPRSVISDQPGEAAIIEALKTGPYGRCVYHCDNDVVDHQVVSMEFEGGISATLTMHGHSHQEGRTLRIDGSKASLFMRMNVFDSLIKVHHHRSRKVDRYAIGHSYGQGHGGGDAGLMSAFAQALTDHKQPSLTTAEASLESHLLAFAAEQARLEGRFIQMSDYRAQAWQNIPSPTPMADLNGKNEEQAARQYQENSKSQTTV